jgi:hypothetical protein
MNIANLHGEKFAHVIDPTLGVPQEALDAAYFRGINMGLVAANLLVSRGHYIGGGHVSTLRHVARTYATREVMASAYPDEYSPHQRPDSFMGALRYAGYTGNEVFPSIVVGFNSDHAMLPDPHNDVYQRSMGGLFGYPADERVVYNITVAELEPRSQAFIKDFFEI